MAQLVLDGVRSSSSNGLSVTGRQVTPRAWATFSPRGDVSPDINVSFNVSSIARLGSGNDDLRWRITFASPMPDNDFAALYTCGARNSIGFDGNMVNVVELTSTYVSVVQSFASGTRTGRSYGAIVVFR
jgi:hypothetical protein